MSRIWKMVRNCWVNGREHYLFDRYGPSPSLQLSEHSYRRGETRMEAGVVRHHSTGQLRGMWAAWVLAPILPSQCPSQLSLCRNGATLQSLWELNVRNVIDKLCTNYHRCFLSDHLESNPEDEINKSSGAGKAKGTHSLEIYQTQMGYLGLENLCSSDAVVQ